MSGEHFKLIFYKLLYEKFEKSPTLLKESTYFLNKPNSLYRKEIIMKIKKSLNRIQVALLKKHINEFKEKDGILEGTEDLIFYVYEFESPKTVKGAILL